MQSPTDVIHGCSVTRRPLPGGSSPNASLALITGHCAATPYCIPAGIPAGYAHFHRHRHLWPDLRSNLMQSFVQILVACLSSEIESVSTWSGAFSTFSAIGRRSFRGCPRPRSDDIGKRPVHALQFRKDRDRGLPAAAGIAASARMYHWGKMTVTFSCSSELDAFLQSGRSAG